MACNEYVNLQGFVFAKKILLKENHKKKLTFVLKRLIVPSVDAEQRRFIGGE
jgi:hypothetical protein